MKRTIVIASLLGLAATAAGPGVAHAAGPQTTPAGSLHGSFVQLASGVLSAAASPVAAGASAGDGVLHVAAAPCISAGLSDPDEGLIVDVASYSIAIDCDSGLTTFSATTHDSWNLVDLYAVSVVLDADNNATTGCYGIDYIAGLAPADGLVAMSIPNCNLDAWQIIGSSTLVHPTTNSLSMSFTIPALRDVAHPVGWAGAVESWYTDPDMLPDGTDLVVTPSTKVGGSVVTPPTNTGGPITSGYWMVAADGHVWSFGGVPNHGNATMPKGRRAVDLEPTPSGDGYWILDDAGGVQAFGAAGRFSALTTLALRSGEVFSSLSSTPTGDGYWGFTTNGRVFVAGAARHVGDMGATVLNGPVVGSSITPTGLGYWMVGSDGGIFSFGDAQFFGSMGGTRLNQPVNGLVPTPSNKGYWLIASDGGIFAFGDAPFLGSLGGVTLNQPVIGAVPFGSGYLMVASDGGIFNFSDEAFYGSLGGQTLTAAVSSVAVHS